MEENTIDHDYRFKRHLANRYGSDSIYLFGAISSVFSFFLIIILIFVNTLFAVSTDTKDCEKKIEVGVVPLS